MYYSDWTVFYLIQYYTQIWILSSFVCEYYTMTIVTIIIVTIGTWIFIKNMPNIHVEDGIYYYWSDHCFLSIVVYTWLSVLFEWCIFSTLNCYLFYHNTYMLDWFISQIYVLVFFFQTFLFLFVLTLVYLLLAVCTYVIASLL